MRLLLFEPKTVALLLFAFGRDVVGIRLSEFLEILRDAGDYCSPSLLRVDVDGWQVPERRPRLKEDEELGR